MITHPVSVQDLIDEIRSDMSSDTATLLLLDDTGTVLEPAASAGLGRRWRGATHVRVGWGFAGKVLARQEPLTLDEINETSVLNPILRDSGVQQLLGVPVQGRTKPVGVLHVGFFTGGHSFGPEDVARLERHAAEIGHRLQERTVDDAHLAALTLQRSLLPAAPPAIDGLDIAVRYLPAEGDLGGDWYDIFHLPNGKVGIALGDVEGHGLRSAIVMGRLRSALRAYALEHDDPAEVMRRLDRKFCHFEADISATVVYAVTEPPYNYLTLCNAGHPAPLFAEEGGERADVAPVRHGLLLGFDPDHVRRSERLPLPPGTAVAFYTDGLVERKFVALEGQDPYGERLDAVRSSFRSDQDAETICSRVIAAGLGDDNADDDVALVVVRRPA